MVRYVDVTPGLLSSGDDEADEIHWAAFLLAVRVVAHKEGLPIDAVAEAALDEDYVAYFHQRLPAGSPFWPVFRELCATHPDPEVIADDDDAPFDAERYERFKTKHLTAARFVPLVGGRGWSALDYGVGRLAEDFGLSGDETATLVCNSPNPEGAVRAVRAYLGVEHPSAAEFALLDVPPSTPVVAPRIGLATVALVEETDTKRWVAPTGWTPDVTAVGLHPDDLASAVYADGKLTIGLGETLARMGVEPDDDVFPLPADGPGRARLDVRLIDLAWYSPAGDEIFDHVRVKPTEPPR
ncbi:MAG: hypothetical protein ACRDD1_01545 [Planctomycetia bacterium]